MNAPVSKTGSGHFGPTRVRIPPSPFRGRCRRLNDAACLARVVGIGGVGSARGDAGQLGPKARPAGPSLERPCPVCGTGEDRETGTVAQDRVNASHAAMDAVPSKRAAKVRNGALLLARIRGAGPVGSDTPAPLRTRYSARARPNRSRPFQFSSDARASVDVSSRTENESSGPVARVQTQRGVRPASRTRRRWRPHGAVASWVLRGPGLAGRPRRCSARRRRGRVTA